MTTCHPGHRGSSRNARTSWNARTTVNGKRIDDRRVDEGKHVPKFRFLPFGVNLVPSLSTMRTTMRTTFLFSLLFHVLADPVSLPFTDCSDSRTDQSQKLQVDQLYGQVLHNVQGYYLNFTVFGTSPFDITGVVNSSLGASLHSRLLVTPFPQ